MGTGVALKVIGTRFGGLKELVPSRLHIGNCLRKDLFKLTFLLRSSPRSISMSQLHALLHLHPSPIYLVFFKGSYWITPWEIKS